MKETGSRDYILVGRFLPGLRSELTVSGKKIDVSANGTTSLAGNQLTEAVLKRFQEMGSDGGNQSKAGAED